MARSFWRQAVAGVILALTASGAAQALAKSPRIEDSFQGMDQQLATMTQYQIDQLADQYPGKTIRWTGYCVEVDWNAGPRATFTPQFTGRPPAGFDLKLIAKVSEGTAALLIRGKAYRIEGSVASFSGNRGKLEVCLVDVPLPLIEELPDRALEKKAKEPLRLEARDATLLSGLEALPDGYAAIRDNPTGRIFLIGGTVVNHQPFPVSEIQLTARIYDRDGRILKEKGARAGLTLTADDLYTEDPALVERRIAQAHTPAQVPVRGTIPFTIVFDRLLSLDNIAQYTVEVTGAEGHPLPEVGVLEWIAQKLGYTN